jgi:outer membrane murein-binding lipoprotein Lpp
VDEHTTDKNKVKPENNDQNYKQKGSSDSSKPVSGAKKAEDSEEVESLVAKVASYELGRQFCAALIKAAAETSTPDEAELMKQAGRRDFDLIISNAAENLENSAANEKQAEAAGAAYFDEVVKQAALEEAIKENQALSAKLAQYEGYFSQLQSIEMAKAAELSAQQQQVKLAESVADLVLNKLKSELAPAAQ